MSWGKPETDLKRFAVLLHIPAIRAVLIPNQAPFVKVFLLPENKGQEGSSLKWERQWPPEEWQQSKAGDPGLTQQEGLGNRFARSLQDGRGP